MVLTLQNLKLGGNLEFSWYSCNILRYCSNRCIVWFFITANCPAQANRKIPVQLCVKIQILFEPPFWICKWANHLSFLAMCRWRMNMLVTSQYQPRFSSKNFLQADQPIRLQYSHQIKLFSYNRKDLKMFTFYPLAQDKLLISDNPCYNSKHILASMISFLNNNNFFPEECLFFVKISIS